MNRCDAAATIGVTSVARLDTELAALSPMEILINETRSLKMLVGEMKVTTRRVNEVRRINGLRE